MDEQTRRPRKWKLASGHVLGIGHDRENCTSCAYQAGWQDAMEHAHDAQRLTPPGHRMGCRG